jgi:hypothetical protein
VASNLEKADQELNVSHLAGCLKCTADGAFHEACPLCQLRFSLSIAESEQWQQALGVLAVMQQSGPIPNVITYNTATSARESISSRR